MTGTLAELLADFGFAAQTLDMNSREEAWVKMDGTAEVRIDDGDGNAPEDWADDCILTVHAYGSPVVRFDGDGFGLADWLEAHDVRQPLEAD